MKPFWKSKTLWFNVISLGLCATKQMPDEQAVYLIPLLNMVLRLLTKEGVT